MTTAPALATPLAPGLAVTVWSGKGLARALDDALPSLAAIGPDVVQLHATPGDGAQAKRVRDVLGPVRLWIGLPADHLARKSPRDAARLAAQYARATAAMGAEMLVLNGEAAWVGKPASLARDVIAAARDAAPGLALGWTSYDHLGYSSHAIPSAAIFGPGGVDYHLPQHYPATPGSHCDAKAVRARIDASAKNCRPVPMLDAHRPRGERWVPYGQAHGHAPSGICALSDAAPLACWWALPTRGDADGILGLRAAAEIRRRAGHAPGHVARWQASAGLVADGIVGPRSLAALGL